MGAPLFFRRAEASFTRYLKEGSLNDAWQIAQVLMQAVITNEDAHWITKSYEKNVRCNSHFNLTRPSLLFSPTHHSFLQQNYMVAVIVIILDKYN